VETIPDTGINIIFVQLKLYAATLPIVCVDNMIIEPARHRISMPVKIKEREHHMQNGDTMPNLKSLTLPLLGIAFTAMTFFTLPAWADHNYQHSETQMDAVFSQLNLTPDQKQRIQAIKQSSRQEAKAHWAQMHTMKNRFEDDVFGPQANLKAAESRVDSMSDHMRQMGKLRVQTLFKIKSVLTPEQNAQFARLWKEKRQAMHAKYAEKHAGK
jgi:Spy/CpxP family protein refolding chaperone